MKAGLQQAVDQSAGELASMQRRLVANMVVKIVSGALYRSIRVIHAVAGQLTFQSRKGRTRDLGPKAGAVSASVVAGDGDAFYAGMLEFGTSNMPARPWFFVAYRAMKVRIKRRIARAFRLAIKGGELKGPASE